MDQALLPLSLCVVIGLLWYAAMRARELAVMYAGRLCVQYGAQMLDQSVALHRLRPQLKGGRPQLARSYRFELSYSGNDRHRGSLTLVGDRLVDYSLPAREGEFPDTSRIADQRSSAGTEQSRAPLPRADGNNVVSITRGRRTLH